MYSEYKDESKIHMQTFEQASKLTWLMRHLISTFKTWR